MPIYRLQTYTGAEIKLGSTVKDFRGRECVVVSFKPPPAQHNSTGRVTLAYPQADGSTMTADYYPSVINARIVEYNPPVTKAFSAYCGACKATGAKHVWNEKGDLIRVTPYQRCDACNGSGFAAKPGD